MNENHVHVVKSTHDLALECIIAHNRGDSTTLEILLRLSCPVKEKLHPSDIKVYPHNKFVQDTEIFAQLEQFQLVEEIKLALREHNLQTEV